MKKDARRVGNTLRPLVGRGWAWKIQDMRGGWHLCNWCEPSRERLERGEKPSPEAIAVCVTMTVDKRLSRLRPSSQCVVIAITPQAAAANAARQEPA